MDVVALSFDEWRKISPGRTGAAWVSFLSKPQGKVRSLLSEVTPNAACLATSPPTKSAHNDSLESIKEKWTSNLRELSRRSPGPADLWVSGGQAQHSIADTGRPSFSASID